MNELTNQHMNFSILHKVLLGAVIAIALVGFAMSLTRPFPLIVLILVYFILGCEKVSSITYKVLLGLGRSS